MIKIITNKEEGTTTCILSDCRFDAIRHISKIARKHNIELSMYECEKYIMNDTYIGTVKCIKPDVFDEEIGKKLAVEKAKSHHRHSFNKQLNKFIENTFDFRVELENLLVDRLDKHNDE